MALFNFTFNTPNNSDNNDQTSESIELQLNEDSVTIAAAEVKGLSIREVFERFSQRLGDTDRINKFVCAGRIVEADSTVQAGMVYRGAVHSESKG